MIYGLVPLLKNIYVFFQFLKKGKIFRKRTFINVLFYISKILYKIFENLHFFRGITPLSSQIYKIHI